MLTRVAREFTPLPLYVTENGASFDDYVDPDGRGRRPRAGRRTCADTSTPRPRDPWNGRRPARLLRVVVPRQLRVGRGLQQAIRSGLRRLPHPASASPSQRPLVSAAHQPSTDVLAARADRRDALNPGELPARPRTTRTSHWSKGRGTSMKRTPRPHSRPRRRGRRARRSADARPTAAQTADDGPLTVWIMGDSGTNFETARRAVVEEPASRSRSSPIPWDGDRREAHHRRGIRIGSRRPADRALEAAHLRGCRRAAAARRRNSATIPGLAAANFAGGRRRRGDRRRRRDRERPVDQ